MLIVANWKAYVENTDVAKKLVAVAKRLSTTQHRVHIVIAPAVPHLGVLAPKNTSHIEFAAQDVSRSMSGAHTGEITAGMVGSVGATYAIVGHSERRSLGETDAVVAEKLQHALAHGLIPILCVGERERDAASAYLAFVRAQITAALGPLAPKDRIRVIIAYEPVWAIGKTAADAIQPHDLAEMVLYIRKVFAELLPGKKASKTQVLYGGSVEPEDIRDLAGGSQVDGFLVGHASVDPKVFSALIKALA
jgi:triosephosphate isomerase (TIM)